MMMSLASFTNYVTISPSRKQGLTILDRNTSSALQLAVTLLLHYHHFTVNLPSCYTMRLDLVAIPHLPG
jgi:hypothetical protein